MGFSLGPLKFGPNKGAPFLRAPTKNGQTNQKSTPAEGGCSPSFFGHEVDQTFNAPLLALAILVVFTVHRAHLHQRIWGQTVIPVDQMEIL